MLVVARTGSGLLLILGDPDEGGFREILEVRPARAGQPGSRRSRRGRASSVERADQEVALPASTMGSHLAVVSGTSVVPAEGYPLAITTEDGGRTLTGRLEFVVVLAMDREWVLPHLLRAYQAGDRIAHHLVFVQPWEEVDEPQPHFFDRYLESRRAADSFGMAA